MLNLARSVVFCLMAISIGYLAMLFGSPTFSGIAVGAMVMLILMSFLLTLVAKDE